MAARLFACLIRSSTSSNGEKYGRSFQCDPWPVYPSLIFVENMLLRLLEIKYSPNLCDNILSRVKCEKPIEITLWSALGIYSKVAQPASLLMSVLLSRSRTRPFGALPVTLWWTRSKPCVLRNSKQASINLFCCWYRIKGAWLVVHAADNRAPNNAIQFFSRSVYISRLAKLALTQFIQHWKLIHLSNLLHKFKMVVVHIYNNKATLHCALEASYNCFLLFDPEKFLFAPRKIPAIM